MRGSILLTLSTCPISNTVTPMFKTAVLISNTWSVLPILLLSQFQAGGIHLLRGSKVMEEEENEDPLRTGSLWKLEVGHNHYF